MPCSTGPEVTFYPAVTMPRQVCQLELGVQGLLEDERRLNGKPRRSPVRMAKGPIEAFAERLLAERKS